MKKDFWEQNAEPWNQIIETGTFKSRTITSTALVEQIHRHGFQSVLDVGCGEGWIARGIDIQKIKYFGIDGSKALIEMARKKSTARFEQVTYDQIRNQAWKPDLQFDAVVFNFSLFEKDSADLLSNAAQFLSSKGRMIIQTLHPCFVLSEYQDGWRSEDFKSTNLKFSDEMPWYGRTLSSWSSLFKQSGLCIEDMIEPMNDGKPASILFVLARTPV